MLKFLQIIFCQTLTIRLRIESEFPAFFKIVVLTLLFKEGEKNKKENYRPVGILPKCQKYLTFFAKYQIS